MKLWVDNMLSNEQYAIILKVFHDLGTLSFTRLNGTEINAIKANREDLKTILCEGKESISAAMMARGL
jgi:hypothetical protein